MMAGETCANGRCFDGDDDGIGGGCVGGHHSGVDDGGVLVLVVVVDDDDGQVARETCANSGCSNGHRLAFILTKRRGAHR